jgi:hypothetical protein
MVQITKAPDVMGNADRAYERRKHRIIKVVNSNTSEAIRNAVVYTGLSFAIVLAGGAASAYLAFRDSKTKNETLTILKTEGIEKSGYWAVNNPYRLGFDEIKYMNSIWHGLSVAPDEAYSLVRKYRFDGSRSWMVEEALDMSGDSIKANVQKAIRVMNRDSKRNPVFQALRDKILPKHPLTSDSRFVEYRDY